MINSIAKGLLYAWASSWLWCPIASFIGTAIGMALTRKMSSLVLIVLSANIIPVIGIVTYVYKKD